MKRKHFIHSVAAILIAVAALHLIAQQPPGFGTYSYDGAGNVTAVGNDTFVYDEFGRIRKASDQSAKPRPPCANSGTGSASTPCLP